MPYSEEREIHCTIVAGTVTIEEVDGFLSILRAIAQEFAVTIQAFNAELIVGAEHVTSAVKKAVRAVEQKKGLTSDLSLEILLYAAGKRQIERALAMGVTKGENNVVIVIVDGGGEKDLDVVAEELKRRVRIKEEPLQELELELEQNEFRKDSVKKFFAITEEELNAVSEEKLKLLVLERVALLDVLK